MATTYSYFYTMQLWANLSTTEDPGSTIEVIDTDGPNQHDNWVQLMPESTSLTLSGAKFTIEAGKQIKVQIRFYQKVDTGTGTPKIYWINSSNVHNANFLMADTGKWTAYSGDVSKLSTQGTGSTSISGVQNPTGGTVFYFQLIPKQSFTASTPFIQFISSSSNGWAGGIIPNGLNGDARNGSDGPSGVGYVPSLAGINPTITISAASQIPPIPGNLKAALSGVANTVDSQGNASSGKIYTVFDPCKNLWHGIAIPDPTVVNQKLVQQYAVFTCKPNNSGLTPSTAQLKTDSNASKQTDINKVIANFNSIAVGDCSGYKSSKTPGGGSTSSTPFPTVITEPSANSQWNPPVFYSSRTAPYSELVNQQFWMKADVFSNLGAELKTLNDLVGSVVSPLNINAILSTQSSQNQGKLFQDPYSAKALNSYQSNLSLKDSTKSQQWGFRFMYNPTSFSYSTSSNNSVDFTNSQNDPSALLVGNSQVTFELYINRILDMSALASAEQNKIDPTTQDIGYSRPLTKDELYGILYRGTEYDIEFLYRVLNGSPQGGAQLLSDDYKSLGGVTSDFGYTTAVPCWLWLHDNLRYYGAVASFQVNHVMFDLRMVPILSVVSITFSRYPALNSSSATFSQSSIAKAGVTQANGALGGTGTTP